MSRATVGTPASVLIICPDYASHYFPLSALGAAWRTAGAEVVVATGRALENRVRQDGFTYRFLRLGPGSNQGLARTEDQPQGEDTRLEAFFETTHRGMAATLRYQAQERLHDLLWRPAKVAESLQKLLDEVRPQLVISDQIAFSATLALEALNCSYISFVPGHPESLPGPGEVYGFPTARPGRLNVTKEELSELRKICERVSARFTSEFNTALQRLAPWKPPVADAFAVTSQRLTLFNYPRSLAMRRRKKLPPTAEFLGSAVREQPCEPELEAALADAEAPTVYVSLGTFLSARHDVLRRIIDALRDQPVRVVLASGIAEPDALGEIPGHWIVRPHLPQVAVLRHCELVITHGGNNTVTESLHAGLPMLVGPFSTDQFAAAADLESAGLGEVFDPNHSSEDEIADLTTRLLTGEHRTRAQALSLELRGCPGPWRAVDLTRDALWKS